MTYLETIKSQNRQIYPEDTFSYVAAQIYTTGYTITTYKNALTWKQNILH